MLDCLTYCGETSRQNFRWRVPIFNVQFLQQLTTLISTSAKPLYLSLYTHKQHYNTVYGLRNRRCNIMAYLVWQIYYNNKLIRLFCNNAKMRLTCKVLTSTLCHRQLATSTSRVVLNNPHLNLYLKSSIFIQQNLVKWGVKCYLK